MPRSVYPTTGDVVVGKLGRGSVGEHREGPLHPGHALRRIVDQPGENVTVSPPPEQNRIWLLGLRARATFWHYDDGVHVYVVVAHPSKRSFTWAVLEAFTRGLRDAGHEVEVGDLYASCFRTDMDLQQYERETSLDPALPVPEDVAAEQSRLEWADGLAFVYPVWWSDCPAKLKGWFDRVWSYGYAYVYEAEGEHASSRISIRKALALCPAGHTVEHLEETGIAESMRRVMVDDRLRGVGVGEAEMVVLGGMVGTPPAVRQRNLETAYRLGREF